MLRKTWFWEQVVFAACLAIAVYGQTRGAEREKILGAIVAALAAFAAQKVRSGVDRQREQDELHGVERARMKCADRIEFWSAMAQGCSILSIAGRGWWDVPAATFFALYPLWRHIYRRFVPVKSDDGDTRSLKRRAADLGSAVASAVLLGKEMRDGESALDAMIRLHQDATKWRMPATERLIKIIQGAQREGENLLDTTERLVRDAQDESDDGATTLFVRPQSPPENGDGAALWQIVIAELRSRPCDGTSDCVVESLVATDMLSRHGFGVAKYGVPLVANNGRDHLADAYQEALDGVVYLRAAVESGSETARNAYEDMLDLAIEIRGMLFERDGK